jgi:ribosome-associated protein
MNKTNNQDLEQLKDVIIQSMNDKKAENITSIDLRMLSNRPSDFFVLCHAQSDRQVEAIAKNIEQEVSNQLNEKPGHKEGFNNKEWILLDYFNLIVHIFVEEKRTFFGLEKLWGDGQIVHHN